MIDNDVWMRLRDDLDAEPTPQSWRLLDERLERERFQGQRPVSPPRRPRPVRRRWLLAVAVAAVAAIGALVIPPLLPDGSPGGATPAAAAILDQVAAVAAHQPAAASGGKYLFLETREADTVSIGPVRHEVAHFNTFTRYEWVAADGSGREVLLPDSHDRDPMNGVDHLLPAGSSYLSTRYIGVLPTDPTLLRRAIVNRFEGGHSDRVATFQFAGTFLQADASPELRRGLYLMVKQLGGVRAVGRVTDDQGRSGEAVSVELSDGTMQLVFDPATSRVLELRQLNTHGKLVHFVLYEQSKRTASTDQPAIATNGEN